MKIKVVQNRLLKNNFSDAKSEIRMREWQKDYQHEALVKRKQKFDVYLDFGIIFIEPISLSQIVKAKSLNMVQV